MSHRYDDWSSATSNRHPRHGHGHESTQNYGHGHGHSSHYSRRSREHPPEFQRSRPEERSYYNPRYGYPSSQTANRPVTPSNHRHARNTSRRSWPPSPIAEDEKASVAKELNPPRVMDPVESEVKSRGSRDQIPLIVDVLDASKKVNLPPKAQDLPLTSESNRKTSTESMHLGTVQETPELLKRAPSPYNFTSTTNISTRESPIDSGYFSSPDVEARLIAEKRKAAMDIKNVPVSDALRGKGKSRGSFSDPQRIQTQTYRQEGPASMKGTGDRVQNRDSNVEPMSQSRSTQNSPKSISRKNSSSDIESGLMPKFSVETFKPQAPPRLTELKNQTLNDVRRGSDSATTLPRPNIERPSPTPVVSIAAAAGLAQAARIAERDFGLHSAGQASSGSGTRPSTPTKQNQGSFAEEGRTSQRHSYRYSSDNTFSHRSSAASSVTGSVHSSRPSSPKPHEFNDVGAPPRRVSTVPSMLEDRAQRPAGLTTSKTISDFGATFHYQNRYVPTTLNQAPSALPYPIDDMVIMPSIEDYRYKPRPLNDPFAASIQAHSRAPGDSNARKASVFDETTLHRPKLDSRRTVAGSLPSISSSIKGPSSRSHTSPTSPRNSVSRSRKAAPPCPRPLSIKGYDDWYTLDGCRNFDICPSCLDANFGASPLKRLFVRSARKEPDEKTRCNFASPWTRLAWTLTQDRHLEHLNLIYDVAKVDARESACPNEASDTRFWYGVIDKNGHPVEDFEVCPCDVMKVEALLPSLRGLFSQRNVAQKRKCDFREKKSRRLPEYLESLAKIHKDSVVMRRQADFQRFAELARQKTRMKECVGDVVLVDANWHFASKLPEFTVCEECYSSVIWPAIAEGSGVARCFNRTPQYLHEDSSRDRDRRRTQSMTLGHSCQLYSPRMRKVFGKAVQKQDFEYLAERAKDRKEKEAELSSKFAILRKDVDDIERTKGRSACTQSSEGRRLQKKLESVAQEWSEWE